MTTEPFTQLRYDPGDEILWTAVLIHRGLTKKWNNNSTEVFAAETQLMQLDPNETELTGIFGEYWRQYRRVCNEFVLATDGQLREVDAAQRTRDAQAYRADLVACAFQTALGTQSAQSARAVRDAWAVWGGWVASAARNSRSVSAARELRDSRGVLSASDTALGWVTKSCIGNEMFERLVGPWETVFPRHML